MARRRVSTAQLRSQLRQAEQKRRQAINRYNAAARKFNREVNQYNQKVRAHTARVRSNRQKLRRELAKLQQTSRISTTTRHVVYRRSVVNLQQSYQRMEASAAAGTWSGGTELLDLAEGETANSVAALNALLEDPGAGLDSATEVTLQTTSVTTELATISPNLYSRWEGALFSLNPRNPDEARHFCTSSREILTSILDTSAPDDEVIAADPNADLTDDNRVTRRAKIRFCLGRQGQYDAELAAFVEEDGWLISERVDGWESRPDVVGRMSDAVNAAATRAGTAVCLVSHSPAISALVGDVDGVDPVEFWSRLQFPGYCVVELGSVSPASLERAAGS